MKNAVNPPDLKPTSTASVSPALRQMGMGALFDALHHLAHQPVKGAKKPKFKFRQMPPARKKVK